MKKLSLLILFSLSTNIFNPVFSKELQVKEQNIFNNLKRQIELLENVDKDINLIDLYRNNGNDDKAIKTSLELLKKNPNNYKLIYKLAELYHRNYELNDAEILLKKIPESFSEYNNVLITLMQIYITQKEKEKAETLLNKNANNLLISAMYDYSAFSLNSKLAKEKLEKYLVSNPESKVALYYLGSILIDSNNLKEAREKLEKAISLDFFYSKAHSLLGYLEAIEDKKVGAGANELKTALRTNPLEYRALISYGNGTTDSNYEKLEKDNENLKSSEYFLSKNREIINFLNLGRKNEAEKILNEIIKKYPDNIHSYISQGNYYINIQEYRKAINSFKKALDISPEYGVANNGLAISINFLIKSQEKKLKEFNIDTYDYSKLDVESVKKVFINFDEIPKKYQKVIYYSIYPIKQYLPVLVASGATHYIIPLYEKSTDHKFGQELKNKTSFDGRLWDDVRGRGGFNSATGIESLEETINFDFNTLTHEFAHQIHGYAFSKEQQAKISLLYEKAKKGNLFLDYYAASNEYEYFAQGVEAFNSKQGKLTLKSTAKNTIEFLKNKDKELYEFIEKISENPITPDNYSSAYLQAASSAYFNNEYDKAIYNYEKAIEVKPSDINSYLLLGNTYFQAGKIDKSIEIYKKVLLNDKNSSYAYIGLAENLLTIGEINESQSNFDKGLAKDILSADSYASYAKLFLEKGDYKSSQDYIDKALKVDPDSALTYSIKALLNADKFYFEQAFKDIDKAIDLDKGNSLYKVRKSLILAKSGSVIKAYQEIKPVEYMYNNNLPVNYEYDYEKSKYYYFNIKDIPTKTEYYYTLGIIKEIEKNYNDATINYLKSLELIPNYYKSKKKLFEISNINGLDSSLKEKIKAFEKK
jgi:tetratricopeptide (TPR) repeat protein